MIKTKNKNKTKQQSDQKKNSVQKKVNQFLSRDVAPKHDYAKLLVEPSRILSGKVPKYTMGRSFAFRRVCGFTAPLTNTNGAFVHFSPESFADLSSSFTPLLFDNGATYNPVTGATTALFPTSLAASMNLNVANIDGIRLVSAGCKLWVTDSALNLKGNMYAMIESTPLVSLSTGTGTVTPQGIHTLSFVQRAEHIDVPITSGEGVIYNWRPRSVISYDPVPLVNRGALSGFNTDKLSVILTGFGATATLNMMMYFHFEVTPDVNGEYAEFPSYCSNITDPLDIVATLSLDTSLFLRAGGIRDDGDHVGHGLVATKLLKSVPDKEIKYDLSKVLPSREEYMRNMFKWETHSQEVSYLNTVTEKSWEFTFPGQYYTGPGTRVVRRVLDKNLPVNQTDVATLIHDIEYLIYNGKDVDLIDDTAIGNAGWDWAGIATRLGLTLRKFSGTSFNNPMEGYSGAKTAMLGYMLKRHIEQDPVWVAWLSNFRVIWS